ncbi:unnamed protein product [Mytilus edulis]|uniref:Uncharacterized protein n=1 Tax=Mytilus edulis TaxID=6550 RepID=A0A8S3QAZ1_MYTED|nr:unnamed protein product [Mytilus edulis]
MVALASCCFKYKRKSENLNKSKSQITQLAQLSSDQTNISFIDESSAYESINEDNMINNELFIRSVIRSEHVNCDDIYLTVDEDASSCSISDGDVVESPNDDYLNPYQSMIEVDEHGYRLLAIGPTQNSKEIPSGRSANMMSDSPKVNVCFQNAETKQVP